MQAQILIKKEKVENSLDANMDSEYWIKEDTDSDSESEGYNDIEKHSGGGGTFTLSQRNDGSEHGGRKAQLAQDCQLANMKWRDLICCCDVLNVIVLHCEMKEQNCGGIQKEVESLQAIAMGKRDTDEVDAEVLRRLFKVALDLKDFLTRWERHVKEERSGYEEAIEFIKREEEDLQHLKQELLARDTSKGD